MSVESRSTQAAETEAIRSAARSYAPDLYLAALLAPRRVRDDLVTLAAFTGEIGRIALTISDPTLALIKLQWWRDALNGCALGQFSGHPVADPTGQVLARVPSLRTRLDELIEAHDHLITASEISDEAELAAYIACTSGVCFHVASVLISGSAPDRNEELIAKSSASYGLIRIAVDLPYFVARGRRPLPLSYFGGSDPRESDAAGASDALALATQRLVEDANSGLADLRRDGAISPQAIAAILPVALVEPYSRALQKAGWRALTEPADISPATRAARLWLASWRRKI